MQCRPSPSRRTILSLSLAAAYLTAPFAVLANPQGGVAVHGTATFNSSQPNVLVVTTQNGAGTNHSAINWQSFSIPAGSVTRIEQPSAASMSINRVVTDAPSALFGTLSSNGKVVLVNQAGIAVGAGALVDTAGFTASAVGMTQADAVAGRLLFAGSELGNTSGALTVQGNIIARGGDVVLIAPSIAVAQSAVVESQGGSVILAAGQSVEVTGRGLEGISLQVQAPTDHAVNLGTLRGDAVGVFASTLKHSGLIQANAVSVEGGRVFLKAGKLLEIGGTVQAQGIDGRGGVVHATAPTVSIESAALIDVSSAKGGGEVLIGGGWHGEDARIRNAQNTFVSHGARIKADALDVGNGGDVVVWADGLTRYAGAISAQGGVNGGNGGNVEVSGKQTLDFWSLGSVSLVAAKGRTGNLLLDPASLSIGTVDSVDGSTGVFSGTTLLDTDYPTVASQIAATTLSSLLNSNSISLAATGNITVSNAITKSSGAATTLTLNSTSGGTIAINAGINGNAGSSLGLTVSTSGNITTSAPISTSGGAVSLSSSAGTITLGSSVNSGSANISMDGLMGVVANGAAITSSGGSVTLTSAQTTIDLNAGSSISANTISLNPTGGVNLNNSSLKPGGTGGIGTATIAGSLTLTSGAVLYMDVQSSTSADLINITGAGNSLNTTSGTLAVSDLSGGTATGTASVVKASSFSGTPTFSGPSGWTLATNTSGAPQSLDVTATATSSSAAANQLAGNTVANFASTLDALLTGPLTDSSTKVAARDYLVIEGDICKP